MSAAPRAPAVVLIGARGSGKTCVGRALASRLGWAFVDADDLVEAECGRSIADIFARQGEPGFRVREAGVLARLAADPGPARVVSAGGGAVLSPDNRRALQCIGPCVWLTASAGTLLARVAADPNSAARRPALSALPPEREIHELLRVREPLYRALARLVVDTERLAPEDIAREIASRLGLG